MLDVVHDRRNRNLNALEVVLRFNKVQNISDVLFIGCSLDIPRMFFADVVEVLRCWRSQVDVKNTTLLQSKNEELFIYSNYWGCGIASPPGWTCSIKPSWSHTPSSSAFLPWGNSESTASLFFYCSLGELGLELYVNPVLNYFVFSILMACAPPSSTSFETGGTRGYQIQMSTASHPRSRG
jgi:hypothetical protein